MNFLKKDKGGIVVEAALILPIFLSFLLLLVTFIKISIVEIELTKAVSEATKQISTHMYPIGILYDNFSKTEIGELVETSIDTIENTKDGINNVEEFISEYSYLFPKEVNSLLAIRDSFEKGIVQIYDNSLSSVFQPLVDYYVDERIIRLENLQVTKVILPDLKEGTESYFGIEIRYDMRLNVPFFDRLITFKKQAYERVWLGDNLTYSKSIINPEQENESEESSVEENAEDEEEKVRIDSISSPVQRGHTVRIIAEGPSNSSAVIRIMYQSGFVKEINGKFNSEGILISDIKIGGNSNEGIYQAILTVNNIVATANFEVLSKDNMDLYLLNRKEKAGK